MADTKPSEPKTTKPVEAKPAGAPAEAEPTSIPAAPTAPAKTSNKTILIVVGVVAFFFVIIPGIILIAITLFVGNKLNEEGVNVNTGSGSVSVTDKNGNEFSAGGNQSLPKDFPAEVPVYKGEIVSSGRLSSDGKTGWTVTISTSDDLTKVGDSLIETFSTDGWETSMNNSTNDGGLIIANKGNLRANLFYSSQDGKTTILYTVTTESE